MRQVDIEDYIGEEIGKEKMQELMLKDNSLSNESVQHLVDCIGDVVYIYNTEIENWRKLSTLIDHNKGTKRIDFSYRPEHERGGRYGYHTTKDPYNMGQELYKDLQKEKLKLKTDLCSELIRATKLYGMMNLASREKFTKDLRLVVENMEFTEHNLINLVNGFLQNGDNVIYESIEIIAGLLTSRTSQFKTNQKAFKFSNVHRLSYVFSIKTFGDSYWVSQIYGATGRPSMYDVIKEIVKLSYIYENNYTEYGNFSLYNETQTVGVKELTDNVTIELYKNGNVKLMLSKEFQGWLNGFLVGRNILK